MNILDKIIENKREEIFLAKSIVSAADLKEMESFQRKGNSLKKALASGKSSGIIAEFKRKSPSKGSIKADADLETIISGYERVGAAGVSILTDESFFGGTKNDLISAREKHPTLPILRKDFMIDVYQLYEAKSWGADVILLIAAALTPAQIELMSKEAQQIGLEVLLEVHDLEELQSSNLAHVDIVGVNNRNLKNFNESNINPSLSLIEHIPSDMVKISESCINDPERIKQLKAVGYQGFLIGESFMKTEKPSEALNSYISAINL